MTKPMTDERLATLQGYNLLNQVETQEVFDEVTRCRKRIADLEKEMSPQVRHSIDVLLEMGLAHSAMIDGQVHYVATEKAVAPANSPKNSLDTGGGIFRY